MWVGGGEGGLLGQRKKGNKIKPEKKAKRTTGLTLN